VKILADIDALLKPERSSHENSSLSITKLAARPSVPNASSARTSSTGAVMALLELIRVLQTTDDTLAAVAAFAKRIGKRRNAREEQPGPSR